MSTLDREATLLRTLPVAKRRRLWSTHFLDVSNNNGAVDWHLVARHSRTTGITASECKATEGTGFIDATFARNRAEAAHFGLRVMPYHFARPDVNRGAAGAILEAQHFARVVGRIERWEWRPMLDYETAPFDAEWVHVWNLRVRRLLGVAPVIYSYFSALHNLAREPLGAGLVLANPNGLPRVAPAPAPWKHWTAHQYTWHGRVAGLRGDVDLNWTPNVAPLLAYPVKGAAWEPIMARRRRKA